jgi:predicted alpha-1,2-mannosidase
MFSRGNCLPLISMPYGMTSWTLQTSPHDPERWPFSPHENKLYGIRATHMPSPWMGDYGHFNILPQTGRAIVEVGSRASTYRPNTTETEIHPHLFSTYLRRYRINVRMTPTERCAAFEFSFADTDVRRIIFDPTQGASGVEFDRARGVVRGFVRANTGGVPENFALYFVAKFDKPVSKFAPFRAVPGESQNIFEGDAREGDRIGCFAEFDPSVTTLTMHVGTSFIGYEQAERNIDDEIGTASIDELIARGESIWNDALGRITIDGATDTQLRTFYTCLYRAQLFPRMFYEKNFNSNSPSLASRGLGGGPFHHYSPYDGQVHDGILYADNGFWDTYRTVYPLLSIINPERLAEILEGWVQTYREGGWFPQWASPGYRACMIGTHIDAVMADGIVKGIHKPGLDGNGGFDAETALAGMRKHSTEKGDQWGNYGRLGIEPYLELGYVPVDENWGSETSRSLDYAYDDFCIAQIETVLGHAENAGPLMERALNYKKLYDASTGFMRGRHRDGSWQDDFSPIRWGNPYVEGGAWQSTWAVPHDPAGLIALMGGSDAFCAKLDEMLTMEPAFESGTYWQEIHEMTEMACADFGQYAHSNQPVHHVLYLFAAAGKPWKTEHYARRVLDELYSPDVQPGDEDNGEMSSWYLLSALGIYPLCPGRPQYVFGSPLFKKATVRLNGGKSFTVESKNNGEGRPYVQGVTVDGKPYSKLWISHDAIASGCTLTFDMGSEPATARKLDADALPHSL